MRDLFIILESSDKNCTENVYLESLKKEMNKNKKLVNIFKFKKSFKIFLMGNISNSEVFERKIKAWLHDHNWYFKFVNIFLIYDNDDDNLTNLIDEKKIKIERFIKENLFIKKTKNGKIFFISPEMKNHTFDEYLCLHFENKIMDKKKSAIFLKKKLNSNQWKSEKEMKNFLDKCCDNKKIDKDEKNKLFKEVELNCKNSIYSHFFGEQN